MAERVTTTTPPTFDGSITVVATEVHPEGPTIRADARIPKDAINTPHEASVRAQVNQSMDFLMGKPIIEIRKSWPWMIVPPPKPQKPSEPHPEFEP